MANKLEELYKLGKISSSAFKEAQALEAVGKKPPALPLDLVRAPAKTRKEIDEIAERIARQQLGEHVKGPRGTDNLAGRSGKENKRIKDTVYNLERTRQISPTKEVTGNVGDINQAVIGDTTISDYNLVDVNGIPIGSVQEGGPRYGLGQMDRDNPFFWASNIAGAKPLQNKVNRLSELYNTDQIMGHHLSMGPVANNFAMHFADANLKAIHNSGTSPESMKAFNDIIREVHPDFPGVHNPQEAMLAMKKDSDMRKYFNDRMKTPSITQALDMPNGLDIQWAITEPELRNMEIAMSGHSVGRLKPGAELIEGADHGTYSHGIQGEVLGHAPELAPFEIAYPDADMYLSAIYEPKQMSGTINLTAPHQKVDAQYLDQLNEYYKRLREIRGFAKGGKVDLEQEFIKADSFAKGGSPIGKNIVSPVATKTGEILGSKGLKELYEEVRRMNPRAPLDIIANTVSSLLGIPGDVGEYMTSKAKPVMGKNVAGMFPTTEDLKEASVKAGISSGAEYPLLEIAALGINPRSAAKGASKVAELTKDIPAGLSIKDVSEIKKAAEFRSSLAKAVGNHKMESMPGPQWSAWINSNASKGAKKEAEASGLHDWLKTQPKVSKYDIEEHIGENLPKIKVIEKGAPLKLTADEQQELTDLGGKLSHSWHGVGDPLTEDELARVIYLQNVEEKATPGSLRAQAIDWERQARKSQQVGNDLAAKTSYDRAEHYKNRADELELNPIQYGGGKWSSYTEPGGTNYQEIMLSLPRKPMSFDEYVNYNMPGARDPEKYRADYEAYLADPNRVSFKDNFHVPRAHTYDDPETDVNRVAHLRTKERPTADKKRALFLEELQSDWAQRGRDEGFRQNLPKLTDAEERRFQHLLEYGSRNLEGNDLVEFKSLLAKRDASTLDSDIPSGPYVTDTKDWTALGLKHALKKAVDEGHDYMAWTTGQQQADRYSLSKSLDNLRISKDNNGAYNIIGVEKDAETMSTPAVQEFGIPENRLEEYIGKEMAKKAVADLAEARPTQIANYNNLDLQVGGEGMKGYYDQIVPSTMNDVLKQIGASERVKPIPIRMGEAPPYEVTNRKEWPSGQISLNLDGSDRLFQNAEHESEFLKSLDDSVPHMGIEITPELRELILNEGLPHFHEGGDVETAKKSKLYNRTTKYDKLALESEFKLADIIDPKK